MRTKDGDASLLLDIVGGIKDVDMLGKMLNFELVRALQLDAVIIDVLLSELTVDKDVDTELEVEQQVEYTGT